MAVTILGIESSCDDTSAAVVRDGYILSNLIADQDIHRKYGGVVPELASRAHQANIVPVVDMALLEAGVKASEIDAVAFTRGPGLLGSLLVGTSFAKGFALASKIPLIEVNHLQAHVLAHFIKEEGGENRQPSFPFLCLLISGGHTQILLVKNYDSMELMGSTTDDAAGEAFDKCAKVMGFPYPGGPYIDQYSAEGNELRFKFSKPRISGLDFSFSGLKTNFLYFLRDMVAEEPLFIENNRADLCASLQKTIIDILLEKLIKASQESGIKEIAIAGGVSANSGIQKKLISEGISRGWNVFIPSRRFTTDNAAMIAINGYYKYISSDFTGQNITPLARYNL